MIFRRCGSAASNQRKPDADRRRRTHWANDADQPKCGIVLEVGTDFEEVEVTDPEKLFCYMDCERCLVLARRALASTVEPIAA